MSKKPANININLVPKDPFFNTSLGRALQWGLSAGRYIVIFTELVVIISFAARFTLDRQITDLNLKIVDQQSVIESFATIEGDFRTAQSKIDNVKQIEQDINILDVFEKLSEVTPQDITLTQLTIQPDSINITGIALSQSAFNLLVNNLQLSPQFLNVSVSKVESESDNSSSLSFSISAKTKEVQQAAASRTKIEKVNVLDRTEGL